MLVQMPCLGSWLWNSPLRAHTLSATCPACPQPWPPWDPGPREPRRKLGGPDEMLPEPNLRFRLMVYPPHPPPCNYRAFQVVLVVKNPSADSGDIRDMGSIPESGRSLGEGHGNPLQYSCLENPMDRGTWRATVHGVTKESDTTEAT